MSLSIEEGVKKHMLCYCTERQARTYTHTCTKTCCCLSAGIGKRAVISWAVRDLTASSLLMPDKLYSSSEGKVVRALSSFLKCVPIITMLSKHGLAHVYHLTHLNFLLPVVRLNTQHLHLSVRDLMSHLASICTPMPEKEEEDKYDT